MYSENEVNDLNVGTSFRIISALAGEAGMSDGPSCIILRLGACFCRTPQTFQVLRAEMSACRDCRSDLTTCKPSRHYFRWRLLSYQARLT